MEGGAEALLWRKGLLGGGDRSSGHYCLLSGCVRGSMGRATRNDSLTQAIVLHFSEIFTVMSCFRVQVRYLQDGGQNEGCRAEGGAAQEGAGDEGPQDRSGGQVTFGWITGVLGKAFV